MANISTKLHTAVFILTSRFPGLYVNPMNQVYDMNVRVTGYPSRRQLLRGLTLLPFALMGCRRPPRKSGQEIVDIYVQSDGDFLAFKPDELTCPTGALIRLTFHHAGRFLSARHNWVLVFPNQMEAVDKDAEKTEGVVSTEDSRVIAFVPMCDKGQTMMTQFVAPAPGDYPFFCATPGHAEDMNGILHVTE